VITLSESRPENRSPKNALKARTIRFKTSYSEA